MGKRKRKNEDDEPVPAVPETPEDDSAPDPLDDDED